MNTNRKNSGITSAMRIENRIFPPHDSPLCFRQGKKERRATILFGLDPDASAMAGDDAMGAGQAHAGALEFLLTMQPVEDSEQSIGILHVKAGAIVVDEDHRFA